jgi:uncharacterized protein (TIGR02453 family)
MYQPSTDVLKKIRQEIDYNGDDLTAIINTPSFRELFGNLQGEKLKRPPKGYDVDHPQIEWLKMKSFLVMHPAKDSTVTQKYFLSDVLNIFRNIIPFNKFLNTAINGECS